MKVVFRTITQTSVIVVTLKQIALIFRVYVIAESEYSYRVMKARHKKERLELQKLIAQIKLALELKDVFARVLGRIINNEQFLILPRRQSAP